MDEISIVNESGKSMTVSKNVYSLPFEEAQEMKHPAVSVQPVAGRPPEYSDDLYRIYMCCSRADVKLEGRLIRLEKGSVLTLSPGETGKFSQESIVSSVCFHHDFFCIRVMREEVFCDGIVFNRLTGLPIVELPDDEQIAFESHLKELALIVNQRSPLANDRAVNLLRVSLLLIADFKLRSLHVKSASANIGFKISPLVQSFQALVEENFRSHQRVEFYANCLKTTPTTLNRSVKKELGMTVVKAVNERLAIEARLLLRTGRRSIKDVAFDLGFNDPLYFSRFFRKHFGNAPSDYFGGTNID